MHEVIDAATIFRTKALTQGTQDFVGRPLAGIEKTVFAIGVVKGAFDSLWATPDAPFPQNVTPISGIRRGIPPDIA